MPSDHPQRTELYRAFIGKGRTDYYLKRFAVFDAQGGGFYPSWNWAAFLFGPVWGVFRTMHNVFWLFGLVALFGVVMLRFSAAHYFLLLGLAWIILTLYANALYYRHAKRAIARAQTKGLAGQELLSHIESKQSVDYGNAAAGVFWIAGISLASVIWVGVVSERAETGAVMARVVEGINAATLVKTASLKFANATGRWPRSNADIGIPARLASYPPHVERIEVHESGVVAITFAETTDCERCAAIENKTITLAPQVRESVLLWTCASEELARRYIPCLRAHIAPKYSPDICRCQGN
jgi:hypothetical protein